MNRSRLLRTLAAAGAAAMLFGACGAITERAVEFGVERAVEADTGENFDLDLSDNGISFSTDEGDFALNVDGDQGTIVFDGDEGSGVIQFDEEGGVVFNTDEGSGSINVNDENLVIETDEGSSAWGTTPPASWPTLIGVPASYNPDGAIFSVIEEGATASYSMFLSNVDPAFTDQLDARLEAAGFTGETTPDWPGLVTYSGTPGSIEVLSNDGGLSVSANFSN